MIFKDFGDFVEFMNGRESFEGEIETQSDGQKVFREIHGRDKIMLGVLDGRTTRFNQISVKSTGSLVTSIRFVTSMAKSTGFVKPSRVW